MIRNSTNAMIDDPFCECMLALPCISGKDDEVAGLGKVFRDKIKMLPCPAFLERILR